MAAVTSIRMKIEVERCEKEREYPYLEVVYEVDGVAVGAAEVGCRGVVEK